MKDIQTSEEFLLDGRTKASLYSLLAGMEGIDVQFIKMDELQIDYTANTISLEIRRAGETFTVNMEKLIVFAMMGAMQVEKAIQILEAGEKK